MEDDEGGASSLCVLVDGEMSVDTQIKILEHMNKTFRAGWNTTKDEVRFNVGLPYEDSIVYIDEVERYKNERLIGMGNVDYKTKYLVYIA